MKLSKVIEEIENLLLSYHNTHTLDTDKAVELLFESSLILKDIKDIKEQIDYLEVE